MRSKLSFAEAADRFYKSAAEANVTVVGEYKGINISVACICPLGHECSPRPGNVHNGQGWCRICAGVDPFTTAIAFYAVAERDGVIVIGKYKNNSTPVACICPNGHECSPMPASILKGNGWCRICVGTSKAQAAANFYAAAKRDLVIVLEDYKSKDLPVACICPNGHYCFPIPNCIRDGIGWCRICAGTDLETAKAKFYLMAKLDNVTVLGKYVNALTSVECVCSKGHKCFPRPNGIQQGQGWCEQCAVVFDRIYLIYGKFDGVWWAKVGIASGPARIRNHIRYGWNLYEQWLGLEHTEARFSEALIKRELKALGCPIIDSVHMPQDGATETFPIEYLPSVEYWVETSLNKG